MRTVAADMWRNLLWSGMIAGAISLIFTFADVIRRPPAPANTPGMDLAISAILGIVVGAIFLGIPACLWTLGRHFLSGPAKQVAQQSETAKAAVAGSAAAIPGGIMGAVAGFGLVLCFAIVVWLFSTLTGISWFNDLMDAGLLWWWAGCTVGGGIIGALLGMVLGGTVGAIFGGIRSAVRH
jgi:hypothetical protein